MYLNILKINLMSTGTFSLDVTLYIFLFSLVQATVNKINDITF